MRSSATGCVGLQQRQGTFVRGLSRHAIAIDKRATIAVQLTNPDLSPRQMPARSSAGIVRESEHAGILSADGPATLAAPFRPLDPGIVNEAIPVFFIGRNMDDLWVARDAKGRVGGIFLLKGSAVSFARKNSRPAGCATIFPSERIELDLDNKGNPLVARLGWLKHFAKRCRQRVATFIGNMTQAMDRNSQFGPSRNSRS